MKLNAMQHVCCRQLLAKWPPCTPERYSLAATVMSEVLAKTVCAVDVSTFELQTRWEEGAYDARTYDTCTTFDPLLPALKATEQPCRYLPPNADSVTAVSGLCLRWFV